MAELGQYNTLRILKHRDIGIFLDGDEYGEILLPRKYSDETMRVGDDIRVFLYNDSEDRIVATTLEPRARVGECAYLKVVSANRIGAFLDWGLPKDLLVPFSEQQMPMQKGYSYAAYLFVDEASERIAASTRLEKYLQLEASHFKPGEKVELLIYGKSDLGFKAVVNGTHLGQLYDNETFQKVHYGERLPGYIKQLRDDGRIDLSLQLASHKGRSQLADRILDHLKKEGGVSRLTDRSTPEAIQAAFGVSKANYKKALGQLYKKRLILIEKERITLL